MTMSDVLWGPIAERLRSLESIVGLGSANARALQLAARLCDVRARLYVDEDVTPLRACARVCVESPFRAANRIDFARHGRYADAAMLDCLTRDEAPFLGHVLYPRVLDDGDIEDRARGIRAHKSWLHAAERVAVYVDLGVSAGMLEAMALANALGIPVVERSIEHWEQWLARFTRTRSLGAIGGGVYGK